MQQNGVHYYSSPKLNLQTIDPPCKVHQDYTGRHWTLKRSLLARPVLFRMRRTPKLTRIGEGRTDHGDKVKSSKLTDQSPLPIITRV
jgi:hypothetical protein